MRLDMSGTARPSRAPRKPPSCSRILRFVTIEVLSWVTPLSCVLYLASRWTAWVSEMGRFNHHIDCYLSNNAYDFI